LGPHDREILRRGVLPSDQALIRPERRLTKCHRAAMYLRGFLRALLGRGDEALRLRRLQQSRLAHERDDIRVCLDVLVTVPADAPALGVDEVGGQVATDVFEAVIEDRWYVLHVTFNTAYKWLTARTVPRSVRRVNRQK